MSATPTNEEIMDAIRDSGYLLEQHVATQLEALEFHVKTNVAFEDPEEGKSREIDVSGIKRVANNAEAKVAAFIELVVECKNTSNPLVFITRPKNQGDGHAVPRELRFPHKYKMTKDLGRGSSSFREIEGYYHLGFDQIHYRSRLPWKAVQFCRIDRKGSSWHANHGGLYDAIFYPMAKAVNARLGMAPTNTSGDWKYIWLLFPLIVTTADLLTIDSVDPHPLPVPRDWVAFSRDLKSKYISGTYAVDFVRRDGLEVFVHECIDPLAALARELVEQKTDFLLRAEYPWQD